MNESKLLLPSEAAELISQGQTLLIAGEEASLKKLPRGQWIGGNIPYFMAEEGGVVDRERVLVHRLPASVKAEATAFYDAAGLASIYEDGPRKGVNFIIIPALSSAHLDFARYAHSYPGYLTKPVAGWVAGVHLSELGANTPKVFDGASGECCSERAVVLRAEITGDLDPRVDIVNIFEQGDGDVLVFPADGFSADKVHVNGEPQSFAAYLRDNAVDLRLPLVANYYGANVNVSFQGVDDATGEVKFYAPVFEGVEYKLARPIDDYAKAFEAHVPAEAADSVFSCNCILNYVHGELEGKKVGTAKSPMTFGEIAYQLLNQTFVYVDLA